jgi:hypothetical protein
MRPEVGLHVGEKILSDHADNGIRQVAERDNVSHNGLVAAELALPQAVA